MVSLPNSGTLVNSAKRYWLIQLLIVRLDQPTRVLPGLVAERIRRGRRSCSYMACGSQRATVVMQNNVTFTNLIHGFPSGIEGDPPCPASVPKGIRHRAPSV